MRCLVKGQVARLEGEGDVSTCAILVTSTDEKIGTGKLYLIVTLGTATRIVCAFHFFSSVTNQEVPRVILCLLVSHISHAVRGALDVQVHFQVVPDCDCLLRTLTGVGYLIKLGT